MCLNPLLNIKNIFQEKDEIIKKIDDNIKENNENVERIRKNNYFGKLFANLSKTLEDVIMNDNNFKINNSNLLINQKHILDFFKVDQKEKAQKIAEKMELKNCVVVQNSKSMPKNMMQFLFKLIDKLATKKEVEKQDAVVIEYENVDKTVIVLNSLFEGESGESDEEEGDKKSPIVHFIE